MLSKMIRSVVRRGVVNRGVGLLFPARKWYRGLFTLNRRQFARVCFVRQQNYCRLEETRFATVPLLSHYDQARLLSTSTRYFDSNNKRSNYSDEKATEKQSKTVVTSSTSSSELSIFSPTYWKNEVIRYYNGFKTLRKQYYEAQALKEKQASGVKLTRREVQFVERSQNDMYRLIPLLVFLTVPGLGIGIPLTIYYFPNALPSPFITDKTRSDVFQRHVKEKVEKASYLRTTLNELAKESAAVNAFVTEAKSSTDSARINTLLKKHMPLFSMELSFDHLTPEQIKAFTRIFQLMPFGNLRDKLIKHLLELKADDKLIAEEGVTALTTRELEDAVGHRGMVSIGLSDDELRKRLQDWIKYSLDENVPPSLLLWSRVLYLHPIQ